MPPFEKPAKNYLIVTGEYANNSSHNGLCTFISLYLVSLIKAYLTIEKQPLKGALEKRCSCNSKLSSKIT